MTPSTSTAERQPPDEATLYCPECSHENRINGDWVIHVLDSSLRYECPNCAAVIDSCLDQNDLIEGSGGSLQFAGGN
jgi:hypothetical protein